MGPFKREFEYFLLLCETLNISKASEEAGIQQAGMSKSLKQLEFDFGQELFYRSNRGLILTPFGAKIQKNIIKAKVAWENSLEKDKLDIIEVSGKFSLGFHPSIALSFAPSFIPSLTEKYNHLKLELVFKKSSDVTKAVIGHEINCGIVVNPQAHPDLVIVPLNTEFIASWSKTKRPKVKVLYFNPEMINIVKLLKKYKEYKKVPIDNYEIIASCMKSSDGECILPSSVASRYSFLNQVGEKISTVKVSLIYHHQQEKTLGFKKLVDSVRSLKKINL